jgi:very-short-patch-repair endonuclease
MARIAMDGKTEALLGEFSEAAAQRAREGFSRTFDLLSNRCESPIERVFLAALIHHLPSGIGAVDFESVWYSSASFVLEGDSGWEPYGIHVYAQAKVGQYRADFLLDIHMRHIARTLIVIECDGHDFHERTKEQAARDKKRDRWMVANGLTVLRFTGSEIYSDASSCARQVKEFIEALHAQETARHCA